MTMMTTARSFRWSHRGRHRVAFQAPALLDTAKGQLSCFCWLNCEDEWQSMPSPPE
jgi:hypothetical protein